MTLNSLMSGGYEVDNELDTEVFEEEAYMTRSDKIRDAIAEVAFTLHQEYEFYLYNLTPEEKKQELTNAEEARNFLAENDIAYDAVLKHIERSDNIEPYPVRFIDRQPIRVETDELPF